MSEYLKISHFGPISEIELEDITPLIVLIGKSGSGKSTVMKVLSLFRWMYKRVNLRSFIKHSKISQTKIGFKTETLLRNSGLLEYLTPETSIVYRNGPYEIILKGRSTSARFIVDRKDLSLEKVVFISDKRSIIPDILGSSIDRYKDNFYLQDTLENFRVSYKYIDELSMPFLGVKFSVKKLKNGINDFRISGEGVNGVYSIKLSNASSGIQTATPIGVIVEYYAKKYNLEDSLNAALFKYFADTDNLREFRAGMNVGEFPNRRVHLFIEEPELSLYPTNQIEMIDFLVKSCFQTSDSYDMTLMMATHSPYIVNYINLLMMRHGESSDSVSLDPGKVGVYLIDEGTLVDLKVKNEQGYPLIDTTQLSDPISDIYNEYDSINAERL